MTQQQAITAALVHVKRYHRPFEKHSTYTIDGEHLETILTLLQHAGGEGKVSEDGLLPCPFCGGRPVSKEHEEGYGHSIECLGCNCLFYRSYARENREEAVKEAVTRWNRRRER